MKIERQETKFQPVTITLETQKEVDILYELLGLVAGTGDVRNTIDSFYSELGRMTEHSGDSSDYKYFNPCGEVKSLY